MITETIMGVIGTSVVGAITWIWQLGTRVVVLETKEPGLEKLIEIRFDSIDQRLGRIERAMNGALHGEEHA